MPRIWLGPLLGLVVGFFLAGGGVLGVIGAFAGAWLGHHFDRVVQLSGGLYQLAHIQHHQRDDAIQKAFFAATFVCLGRVAKCDGAVREAEIEWARVVMERMGLGPEKKREAVALFEKGKDQDYDIGHELKQLQDTCGRRTTLIRIFMEMLVQGALADGPIKPKEWAVLTHVAGAIRFRVAMLERLVRSTQAYQDYQREGGARASHSGADTLVHAYGVLGVEPGANTADIKKAYRRLINQHHPDKLIARGLPEEMLDMAKERTQAIHAAYEEIKLHRKTETSTAR